MKIVIDVDEYEQLTQKMTKKHIIKEGLPAFKCYS